MSVNKEQVDARARRSYIKASFAAGMLALGGMGGGALATHIENDAASAGVLIALGVGIPTAIVQSSRRADRYSIGLVTKPDTDPYSYNADDTLNTQIKSRKSAAIIAGAGSVIAGALSGPLAESADDPITLLTYGTSFVAGLGLYSVVKGNMDNAEIFQEQLRKGIAQS